MRNIKYVFACRLIANAGGILALSDICRRNKHKGAVAQAQSALSNLAANEANKVSTDTVTLHMSLRWIRNLVSADAKTKLHFPFVCLILES